MEKDLEKLRQKIQFRFSKSLGLGSYWSVVTKRKN